MSAAGAGRRWTVALAVWAGLLTLVLLAIFYHVVVDYTRHWDFNGIRLQRSFALRAGVPLYAGNDSGVILNTIYGPIPALAYLPATLATEPAAAILTGQVLALSFFLLPILWLHGRAASPGRGRLWAVFGGLSFAALTVDLRHLEYVAFTVHVDAPTLGLAALAGGTLAFSRPGAGWWRFGWAALWTVLAVWSKLMALPLLVVLPAYVGLTEGWRRAGQLVVCLVVVGGLVSAAVLWFFGPADNVLLNLWTVPVRQSARITANLGCLETALRRNVRENWVLWLLICAAVALELRRGRPAKDRWWASPGVFFAAVGLSHLPLAIVAYCKPGGDVNALSYDLYFLLAGLTLTLTELAQSSGPRRVVAAARGLLAGVPGLVVLAVILFQEPGSLTSWRRPLRWAELPHQRACEYARRHPEEVYFPRLTLASYLAEGRVYHQSVGLVDRLVAGNPPSQSHLRAHLPRRLRAVAMAENGFMREVQLINLAEFSDPYRDPELPGFLLFRRPPPEPPSP